MQGFADTVPDNSSSTRLGLDRLGFVGTKLTCGILPRGGQTCHLLPSSVGRTAPCAGERLTHHRLTVPSPAAQTSPVPASEEGCDEDICSTGSVLRLVLLCQSNVQDCTFKRCTIKHMMVVVGVLLKGFAVEGTCLSIVPGVHQCQQNNAVRVIRVAGNGLKWTSLIPFSMLDDDGRSESSKQRSGR